MFLQPFSVRTNDVILVFFRPIEAVRLQICRKWSEVQRQQMLGWRQTIHSDTENDGKFDSLICTWQTHFSNRKSEKIMFSNPFWIFSTANFGTFHPISRTFTLKKERKKQTNIFGHVVSVSKMRIEYFHVQKWWEHSGRSPNKIAKAPHARRSCPEPSAPTGFLLVRAEQTVFQSWAAEKQTSIQR